jgi:hypothetical protein
VKLQLMKTSIALTALLTMFPPVRLVVRAHPASPQDTRNAAVKYLRADASLRQSYALPTDAAATLQKALESPLDGEEENLVASADEALREFHHGASSKRCDWEMSAEDGALANTAHRGAIIELAYVSGLRARLRFRDGNSVGAAGDLIGRNHCSAPSFRGWLSCFGSFRLQTGKCAQWSSRPKPVSSFAGRAKRTAKQYWFSTQCF